VFQRDGGRCAVTNYWSTNWEGAISPAGAYRVSTEVAHTIPFSRHNDVKFREACLFYAGLQPYKLTDEQINHPRNLILLKHDVHRALDQMYCGFEHLPGDKYRVRIVDPNHNLLDLRGRDCQRLRLGRGADPNSHSPINGDFLNLSLAVSRVFFDTPIF
jgi:hypothetical protein